MSSRTRARRSTAIADSAPLAEASSSRSTGRSRTSRKAKVEPEVDQEELALRDEEALALGEADEDAGLEEDGEGEEEDVVEPTPSKARAGGRKGKSRAKAGNARTPAGKGRNIGNSKVEEDDEQGDDAGDIEVKPSRRLRKSVSYKEVPVEEPEDEGRDDVEEGAEDTEEEEAEPKPRKRQPPVRLSSQTSNTTPRKRSRPSMKATTSLTPIPALTQDEDENNDNDNDDDEGNEDEEDDDVGEVETPSKFDKIPGGSGRGGFSVKGAAAAAAKARWAKVRREKIERGEDPDEPRSSSAKRLKRKRDAHIPDADNVVMDSTITIKGEEYKVGDDELILDEDEKGNAKVDAEGRLLGGREYKLVTFTSATRRNPERLYAMTIDAARACGYTDSLAFLRRCPQILKLSCTSEERQLLIDIGRIAGNLRHRQVTMVSVRNVFKLMGARVIKGGKWVTDDYYEDEAVERCKEMGIEPGTIAEEEEIHQQQNEGGRSSRRNEFSDLGVPGTSGRYTYSLTPFYTIGGPTTTFGNQGSSDPFSESGWGNKRQKLKSAGVTHENWIYLTSKDSSRINGQLKEYRNERLVVIDKKDDLERKWVFMNEQATEVGNGDELEHGHIKEVDDKLEDVNNRLLAPELNRKRSGLSQDVTRELTQQLDDENNAPPEVERITAERGAQQQQQQREDIDMTGEQDTTISKPEIVIGTPDAEISPMFHWGLGSWSKGVIRAVYEPHTNTPHVPLHTQPTHSSTPQKISYNSIISSSSTAENNIIQSSLSSNYPSYSKSGSMGIASLEYVFEPSSPTPQEERLNRMKMVEEAVEWEKEMRRKSRKV